MQAKLCFLVNVGFEVHSHGAVICVPEAWGVLSWLKAHPAAFEHVSLLQSALLLLSLPSAIVSFAKPACILSTTDRKAVAQCSRFYIQTIRMSLGRINAGAANCEITNKKD